MPLFGIAACRLAFCKLLLRRGEILLDGVPAGNFPRYLCLELRLAPRRLPFGSEPLRRDALFGTVQSGVGGSQLRFEHLQIRKAFDPLRFQPREALRGSGGIDRCFLSRPLEGDFNLAQPLVNQVSSGSGLR